MRIILAILSLSLASLAVNAATSTEPELVGVGNISLLQSKGVPLILYGPRFLSGWVLELLWKIVADAMPVTCGRVAGEPRNAIGSASVQNVGAAVHEPVIVPMAVLFNMTAEPAGPLPLNVTMGGLE